MNFENKACPVLFIYHAQMTNNSKIIILTVILFVHDMTMDLSPFRQNFEKNRNRQKYRHSLKEHPTFTKIAKFGCEML